MGLNPDFINGLKRLSIIKANDTDAEGLYFLKSNTELSPYIRMHIEEAKPYQPTAIYVKKFENGNVKPQVYIYDNTNQQYNTQEIARLHKRLWSAYKVPMFFVFSKTEVKIYNCLQKPNDEITKITPLESIEIASMIDSDFNAQMFDTGAFWDTKQKKNFSFKNSVYEFLLNDLKELRKQLIAKKILTQKTTESLLIKSILLRYLEERGVFNYNGDDTQQYWSKFKKGATSFTNIFDDNKVVIDLFDDLNIHFNGGIFDLNDDERQELLKANLIEFKYFLEGNKDGKQLLLWSRYSFKDLPIELISNIYELFLKSEDKEKGGIVYTPPILVDFMIDEIMPLDKPQKNFKLIDPSCGSGIFLVGAYKRLIQWWKIENDWKNPTIQIAQDIIKNNIYGVDREQGAVEVSIFSLSLALCDTFLPDEIWSDLRFDNLRESENILEKDFFEYVQDTNNHKKFDLVIGNPPFVNKSQLWTDPAKKLENSSIGIPDKQLSFLFLDHSFKLLKENKILCMVQPSAFLYSQNSDKFRNRIFKNYRCKQIVDFACLNTSLFKKNNPQDKGADVAVSVSFIEKSQPNIKKESILHVTVRNTFLAKEKIYFDLSHYDFHWLAYQNVLDQKSIWKCNLMGGSRIKDIIKRLESYPTLKSYLDDKKKSNNWLYLSGFESGSRGKPANFLTNSPTLPTDAFTEEGIDYKQVHLLQDTSFHRPKQKELFESPLALIKEVLGKKSLLVEYVDKPFLSFRKTINGIHAPREDTEELKGLVRKLKEYSLLYIFYLNATSGLAGVSMGSKILKKNIDLLPYPKEEDQLNLSKTEKYFANDTIDYMMNFCKGNENSPLLNNISDEQLQEFQSVYCELLNSTYDNFNTFETYETDSFIICSFYYKNKPLTSLFTDENISDNLLYNLVNKKIGQNVNIKRVIRLYDENMIYFIKPKQYRFWLKSIAVQDADETFVDLVKMGY